MDESKLPWQRMFGKRCGARKRPEKNGFYGRCELAPHADEIAHTLERGLILVRWFDGPVFEEHTEMAVMLIAQKVAEGEVDHIVRLADGVPVCMIEDPINGFVTQHFTAGSNWPCPNCSSKLAEEARKYEDPFTES